jgi:hypothetical protein
MGLSRPMKFCGLCLCIILALVIILLDKKANAAVTKTWTDLKDLATQELKKSEPFSPIDNEVQTSLNQFFENPSKELNVPSTTAFFQNVPSTSDATQEQTAINKFSQQMENDVMKDSFNIKDFLPQEIHDEWFQTDLTNAKNEVDQSALIDISKFCQGVDTVGQSLKNPSYDLRGNIPNPKIVVSPWQNSSYDPDTNIKSWN